VSSEQIILHHYPQSPVTEKVRVVLGMKGLNWKSVLIPRLPPKPNLMPLTGGYRLTPVMQIGADIYCDTKCIIDEIERRTPTPTLFPSGRQGLSWALGQWTDGPLFTDVVTVALVEMSPNMPPEFLADRGPLYFGSDFSLEGIKDKYATALANVRAQFGWIDDSVKSQGFMLGEQPGLADALAYYLVWFLRDRMADGEAFMSQFEHLQRWEQHIKAIGHGRFDDMSDEQALDIAKNAKPLTPQHIEAGDPRGLNSGDTVSVQPASGGPKVVGTLYSLGVNRLAVLRDDPDVGKVAVHFPRLGYVVKPA